jgi:hypothetical protein
LNIEHLTSSKKSCPPKTDIHPINGLIHHTPLTIHLKTRYLRHMGQYSIGDAIRQFLAQSRIKGSIQALQVEDVWESVMGKTIARYTESLKVIDRTLFITTNVAPLKQELVYQKEKIKLRVNEALGEKVIDDIIIK